MAKTDIGMDYEVTPYPNTLVNQWKKFLLMIHKDGVSQYLKYWETFPEKSENTKELIRFCKNYLSDIPLWGVTSSITPREFNLINYEEVILE